MDECRIPPEAGVGASGGGPPEHGYPPEPRTDQEVIEAVRTAFFLDPDFADEQFEILSENGVVTLRGFVRSEDERRRAIDIASDVQGVNRVIDQLVVRA